MRVLLTRSKGENELLQAKFQLIGISPLEIPLLSFADIQYDWQKLKDYENIVLTSKYAAMRLPPELNNRIWCVGEKSAEILTGKGNKVVFVARGASELKNALPPSIHKNSIYLSGNIITEEMPPDIQREVIYKTLYLAKLSVDEIAMIHKGFDYILFFSENSALCFIKLLEKYSLLKSLSEVIIVTISPKVENIMHEKGLLCVLLSSSSEMLDYFKREKNHNV